MTISPRPRSDAAEDAPVMDVEDIFLTQQKHEITQLADRSDILSVRTLAPRAYWLHFDSRGLVEPAPGEIVEHVGFDVGVYLHEGYLRHVDEPRVLTLAHPASCWHPNARAPLICIGPIAPGTPLVEIARRTYELLSYQSVGAAEKNALHPEVCQFVRANLDRFPVDARPLEWKQAPEARP
jgi:hypothetical protein